MRKICIVTGSRADFYLIEGLIKGLKNYFEVQVVATGQHFSPEFGFTYRDILSKEVLVDRCVEMSLSTMTASGVGISTGLGTIGLSNAFAELMPDLVIILGDRYEILAAATAALLSKIPIAHIHGGEKTVGSYDDAIRHAVTKMSHIHFVASEEYRTRVIQLGENPQFVFNVGGLGVDALKNIKLMDKAMVEERLCLNFREKALLITYHPETALPDVGISRFEELLIALDKVKDTTLIFTYPNADVDGVRYINRIKEFKEQKNNVYIYKSMGQELYLSCATCVDGVVGNSSSGILEIPSLKKGVINIGDRQKGRLQSELIINVDAKHEKILEGINSLYSDEYKELIQSAKNPYGDGGATNKIIKILMEIPNIKSVTKEFNDL